MLSQSSTGWRFGLILATGVSVVVTISNVLFLVISVSHIETVPDSAGEGVLFSGECKKAKQISTWSHLLINILGTSLLAASNFTQQILTAPTREEIDKSHAKRKWLDIGVPLIHNLPRISKKRLLA
ncbi:hypothetical protein CGCS363_v007817 [Colletotrichum siamense]|uniref:uncharacterized protein n=1 Tax=Colletotrichum siamense TaxID=690259 RepID=UPI0018726D78|nr:uncharacterized protein CGCS363_v007817 [Colletotrichum siamense]KAF5497956.1 hypothetical protein CGCS363_v007817 [Colletotrichum siamense]